MAQVRSWAGLDVHARSVLAVTVDSASGEMRTRRLPVATSEVVAFCAALPSPIRYAHLITVASAGGLDHVEWAAMAQADWDAAVGQYPSYEALSTTISPAAGRNARLSLVPPNIPRAGTHTSCGC